MQPVHRDNQIGYFLVTNPLINLIDSQKYNDKFSRLDLIVRYAFLEGLDNPEIYEERKSLYEKMQFKRCGTIKHTSGETFVNEFIKVAASFRANGYLPEFPLAVNEDDHLINSSHRASCCLYYNINDFTKETIVDWRSALVNKNPTVKSYFMYGRDWFEKNGFTTAELQFLDNKRLEVMNKIGHYFVFTLWDPSKHLHDKIIKDISRHAEILSTKQISLPKKAYRDVVLSIYEIDDISEERIHQKITNMPQATELTYVTVHIWSPTFRAKNVNPNVQICTEVEDIKKAIRNKYKPLVSNYYYDNIVHAGDNFEHTKHIMRVFESVAS